MGVSGTVWGAALHPASSLFQGISVPWGPNKWGFWMGMSLRKTWPGERRITLPFWMLLNDLGHLLGKVRFSQSPRSPCRPAVYLGGLGQRASEDAEVEEADGTLGLPARALPTGDRLSVMKNEKALFPHSPIPTSKL